MNKALRKHVTSLLQNYHEPHVSLWILIELISGETGITPLLVERELRLMLDDGLVEELPGAHWRVTSKGTLLYSPLLDRSMVWLSQNILGVIALSISAVGLVISIIATVIAAFALHIHK